MRAARPQLLARDPCSRDSRVHTVKAFLYSATELKGTMKKVDFFPRAIDCKASLPFDQAWSRASKNVIPCNQSPPIRRKAVLKVLKMADFVWGFWSL